MDLYLKETQAKALAPSLRSNDIEQMKQEIHSLKEQNKDLSEKLTQSGTKSTQPTTKGEASSSGAKSKITRTYLHQDE